MPGDWAKVAADGSLILLGRGSNCINTGGEKVFPEEVEEAVKATPRCTTASSSACPTSGSASGSSRWRRCSPARRADEGSIIEGAADHIARYKLPKQVIIVDRVQRAANGKADYPWAREVAASPSSSEAAS